MRISVETLLKLAQEQVSQRAKSDYDVIAAYLYGSLLGDDPLIGGTGDIDLMFIHNQGISERREIVRITDDIHLDITHAGRDAYRQTRELRLNPWMGPVVNGCKILHDPQHFMDFVQAGVRGQFDRPDNVRLRVQKQLEHARQIWLGFQLESGEPGLEQFASYLKAVDHAANAVAVVSGPPLGERRFLQRFVERSNQLGQPALAGKLLTLIGGPKASPEALQAMLPAWELAFKAGAEKNPPARLHPLRQHYYQKAFETFLSPGQPYQATLWPLLRTWTGLAQLLDDEAATAAWKEALSQLDLLGAGFGARLEDLDKFLDQVEELLESWSRKMGA